MDETASTEVSGVMLDAESMTTLDAGSMVVSLTSDTVSLTSSEKSSAVSAAVSMTVFPAVSSAVSSAMASSTSLLASLAMPGSLTEKEAVRCIYAWICNNIRYDTAAWRQGIKIGRDSLDDESPLQVIRTRQATCKGYASLFQAMCRICGIPTQCVRGFVKGCGYKPGDLPNHVWNAVQIHGCWFLIDCSWGAGYLSHKTEVFVQDYTDYYFLCEPMNFIRDHFPLDARWQLLKTPISLEDFEAQGCTKPGFCRLGLTSLNPDKAELASNGSLSLSFTSKTTLDYTYSLVAVHCNKNYSGLVKYTSKSEVLVYIAFPEKGRYKFTLYGKEKGRRCEYQSLISYDIKVNECKYTACERLIINDIMTCPIAQSSSWGWTSQCFAIGLKPSSPISCCSHLDVTDGQCSVTVTHEPFCRKVFLKAILYSLGGASQPMTICPRATTITSQANEITIKAQPPHPGTYSLLLYGSDRNAKPMPCIARFLIIHQLPQPSPLDRSYKIFQNLWPNFHTQWNKLTYSLFHLYKLTRNLLSIQSLFLTHDNVS